jgi:hypothetical protein
MLAALGSARAQEAAIPLEKVLEIGGDDADGPAAFARVSGLAVGPDGEIVVLDAGTREVRVFGASGRFARRFGRVGSGPGEFRHPVALRVDSVVTVDDGELRRASVFSLSGRLLRTAPVSTGRIGDAVVARGLRGGWTAVLSGGRFVYGGPGNQPLHTLALVSPAGAADTLARWHAGGTLWHAAGAPLPWGFAPGAEFGEGGAWAVWGDSLLAVADGYAAEVRWYRLTATGAVRVRTRALPSRGREVTSADLDELEARMRNAGERLPARIELIPPPRWSSASRLVFAGDGSLWVRNLAREDGDSVWTVFSPAGDVALRIRLPGRFDLQAVRGADLYGVWKTENGADAVRVYRILSR